jgi:RNA polymerase sigma-70 factor (ECF subfamily)
VYQRKPPGIGIAGAVRAGNAIRPACPVELFPECVYTPRGDRHVSRARASYKVMEHAHKALPMTRTANLDTEALVRLYDDHSPGLYRYACRLLGDQAMAEDCVSETFTRFVGLVQRKGIPAGNLRAYLYRMAHNWIVDHYRRAHPTEPLADEMASDAEENPESWVMDTQAIERLRRALVGLPEEQRLVIELRFMEDWSHEQVAEFLGRTIEATRALQHRGLDRLRKSLTGMRKQDI